MPPDGALNPRQGSFFPEIFEENFGKIENFPLGKFSSKTEGFAQKRNPIWPGF